MKRLLPLSVLMLVLAVQAVTAQTQEFNVAHQHTFGECRGTLIISVDKIQYKTTHEKHARDWQYVELQQVKVESRTVVELLTYEDQKWLAGQDRQWRFELLAGEITSEVTSEISAFLMAHAKRPLITSVMPVTTGIPRFEVPVKHLHNFGGCSGTLRVYDDRAAFESAEKPDHARFWRYTEIQNFSQSERFKFEIATFETGVGGPKEYNFQLKQELPADAYEYVWRRVYPSRFPTGLVVPVRPTTK